MSATLGVTAWAVALMVCWQPLGRTPWPELRGETEAETVARYTELAQAAERVAAENPPLFDEQLGGRQVGRLRTLTLLLSISWHESAFHNRVTTNAGGDRQRSDRGRSWCAGQVLLGRAGAPLPWHYRRLVPELWTGAELEADPHRCMTVVYRFLRQSMQRCAPAPLATYTGEPCRSAPKARRRLARALAVPLP
ncbi:MAG: hypothetical protein WKG00_03400 [Polyangiaceae bacterium]